MHVASGDAVEQVERRYPGTGYGVFKQDVADAVVALMNPIRGRYEELRSDEEQLRQLLTMGAERARANAEPMLNRAYERMGFLSSDSPG
jgi:tryptophanyl-tRNA synthetase